MKLKKKEALIFGIILIAAVIALFLTHNARSSIDYGKIRISVEGEEFGVYDLGTDRKVKINGTNTCRIRDGVAQMIEATCPDHLCIHQSPIDARGGIIICLPNQVIIEGIPAEETSTDTPAVDAVAQ